MSRRWSEDNRRNIIDADWIVAWIRANGPATIREIIAALNESDRKIQAHVIKRALLKSPFIKPVEQRRIGREWHFVWSFDDSASDSQGDKELSYK